MKRIFNRIFIDGLGGMALGLFATLIIGTIMCQVAEIIGDNVVGTYLSFIGNMAKSITGAGIGVGVATKLKASPLTAVSAAVAGLIGAFPNLSLAGLTVGKPGEPLGAFIAAYVAVEVGVLISGKTKLDIILTPMICILSGSVVGLLIGPYITSFMTWLGSLVNISVVEHPIICGMIVSVLMGIFLTLPISSAAIGISIQLGGLAAGAATIGCCCNMIGFAVISYRENKLGGLISQGVGTSMIQMPNIVRNPRIWIPSIVASAVLAPISTVLLKMTSTPVGSGMGTSGLVGQFAAFESMTAIGTEPWLVLIEIAVMHFILPAVVCLGVAEALRKLRWIKPNDLKLTDLTK